MVDCVGDDARRLLFIGREAVREADGSVSLWCSFSFTLQK
jgi:hypothetical protein